MLGLFTAIWVDCIFVPFEFVIGLFVHSPPHREPYNELNLMMSGAVHEDLAVLNSLSNEKSLQ